MARNNGYSPKTFWDISSRNLGVSRKVFFFERGVYMTTERDFKGVWIPKEVWLDERLGLIDKYYLSIYRQCGNNEAETDKMMKQIASTSTICGIKYRLKALKFIKEITDYEEAKNLVLKRKGQGNRCEWCGNKTYALQEHHFPIPKSKGGKETVLICPNCHYEYHAILKDKE